MVCENSFEFLKSNNSRVMAVALCQITLDNLANNYALGEDNLNYVSEIEATIIGIQTAGQILCKNYNEKLSELRAMIIREFNLDKDG
ncbi:MAG: hypothetical protein WCD89_02465 [Anaerocolumna sp.]